MATAERVARLDNADPISTAIAVLRQRFGERVQTGEAIRHQHANTLTWIPNQPPDAVIWVETTDEVREVVAVAAGHGVPIIPFGAGTSLEGHINAPRGGLSLDFGRMNRVLSVNERDLDCVVEAGVSRKQLNDHLRDLGLFFPVDPGAEEATLGGMASTRASGTTAVRYGTMRENVLNLTAVMADGSVVKTAQRARKSAAGYDLTRLLVGSEGTLGIITELTVRLYGIPERILAAVCPFETLEGACNAVIQSIQLGLGVARMELLDPPQIRAVNRYAKLGLDEKPTLFLEFHGSEVGARDQVATFKQIAESEGAIRFDWAEREEDRRRLWKARHDVYWAIKTVFPGRDAHGLMAHERHGRRRRRAGKLKEETQIPSVRVAALRERLHAVELQEIDRSPAVGAALVVVRAPHGHERVGRAVLQVEERIVVKARLAAALAVDRTDIVEKPS